MGIVLLAGIVGACFSAQQRAQTPMPETDVQTRVQVLTRLAESFYFAPIGGAIGALVLFCLFAGELVQGQLFPKVWTSDSSDTHSFFAFLVSAGPDNGMEMAKLLAWCFIAGFSERLIPSALDQLGGRLSVRRSRPERLVTPLRRRSLSGSGGLSWILAVSRRVKGYPDLSIRDALPWAHQIAVP